MTGRAWPWSAVITTLGLAVIALFEQKSWKHVAINGGYMTVAFVLMGTILGAWR